jgi:DNA adenine methylase
LKSPLTIMGGKTYMLKYLIPLIPKHKTYVEVFAGSAQLFFAKDPSLIEVVNDVHGNMINFYKVLRSEKRFKKLVKLCNLTPHSREQFYKCRSSLSEGSSVIRAWKFFTVVRQCFSGRISSPSWGRSVTECTNGRANAVDQYLKAIERLPEAHSRMQDAQIENQDFRKIIKAYDRKSTFFYLDPPYIMDTRHGNDKYNHEMSDKDHKDLISLLLDLKGKALISGYNHRIYSKLEKAGWNKQEFIKISYAAASTKQSGLLGKGSKVLQARTEVIWYNYSLPKKNQ